MSHITIFKYMEEYKLKYKLNFIITCSIEKVKFDTKVYLFYYYDNFKDVLIGVKFL